MKTTNSTKSPNPNLENLFSYKKPKENDWLKVCLKKLTKRKFKIWYTMLLHFHQEHDLFITTLSLKELWIKLGALCHIKDHTCPDPYSISIHDYAEHWKKHPYYFFDVLTLSEIAINFAKHCDDNVVILARVAETLFLKDTRASYEYIMQTLDIPENPDESIDDLVLQTEEYLIQFP